MESNIKTLENFVEEIQRNVTQQLGSEFNIQRLVKNNGVVQIGITPSISSGVVPIIGLSNYYEQYKSGRTIDSIIEEVVDVINNTLDEVNNINTSGFLEYEKVKDAIYFKLVNRDRNKDCLDDVVHEAWLDLEKVYYARVGLGGDRTGTVVIKKTHCKIWGVTEEAVKAQGDANHSKEQYEMYLMSDLLRNQVREVPDDMWVLTNQEYSLGAAGMVGTNQLQDLADIIEIDLIIIPSSIHEVIIVPYTDNPVRTWFIKEMVRDVNANRLSKEEYLSDSIYIYRQDSGEIEIK